MSAERHLKVVEFDGNGEVIETRCPDCRKHLDELAGAERIIRRQSHEIAELQRDRAQDAREHPLWPVAKLVYSDWRVRCNHKKSPWTTERFWIAEPFLSSPKYAPTLEGRVTLCLRAVAGAEFDAFRTPRKNGTTKSHDDWDQSIFKTAGRWEEFCCKAPPQWQPTISPELREAIAQAERLLAGQKQRKRGAA